MSSQRTLTIGMTSGMVTASVARAQLARRSRLVARTRSEGVAVTVAVARRQPRRHGRRQDRQQASRIEPAALLFESLDPVALLAHVGHLRLTIDRGNGDEVDERISALRMRQLELATIPKRVIGAGVDADAAQDAATLVHVVFLEHARLGHQGARWAGFGAAAARHAGRVVEAHVERRRDQRVEADPHEVVARRADHLRAHLRAAAAIDAA